LGGLPWVTFGDWGFRFNFVLKQKDFVESVFTNIAIVSQSGPELQEIRKLLRNPVFYTVREFLSLDDVNQGLLDFPFDVLLMRLGCFESMHVNLVLKVRARFPNVGLVTLSPEARPETRYQLKDVYRHKLLLEPLELLDLPRVIEKLVRGELSPTRLHPRVHREGECELVEMGKGEKIPAKFLDFAQLGAKISVHPRSPLKVNTIYQLHYPSTTDRGRIQKIASKVVWAKVSSGMVGTIMKGPHQTLGLRFIAAI